MAHLPENFVAASSNLEPEEDAKNAKSAHEDIRAELADDAYLTDLGLETLLIGSYGRDVSIKRVKDVDVFAMLEDADDTLISDEIVSHVVGLLKKTHHPDHVTRQDHSIVVDLPQYDLSVDVVPARPFGDHWEIPDAESQWLETNPLELGDLTTNLNKEFTLGSNGIYVPIVKLIRQIRRACGIERPSGLYFEILTYWAFESENVSGTTQASYLASSLAGVQKVLEDVVARGEVDDPTLPGKSIATKATSSQLDTALEKVRSARALAEEALEDEDFCESAKKWRKLLGKDSEGDWVFPLLDDCSDDAKSSSIYVPGEKRGPSGSDRFA